jgi:hypothetical protein
MAFTLVAVIALRDCQSALPFPIPGNPRLARSGQALGPSWGDTPRGWATGARVRAPETLATAAAILSTDALVYPGL